MAFFKKSLEKVAISEKSRLKKSQSIAKVP